MEIELDKEVVNHFKKYWGSEEDFQEKMEEVVNDLLKDWITVEHSKREQEKIRDKNKEES